MIGFYLMICGVIIGAFAISLFITYIYVKLIFSIGKRYSSRFSYKPTCSSREKGNYTDDTINFIVFLKCIYNITHLNSVWNVLRYTFRILKFQSKIKPIYTDKEGQGDKEDNKRSPKPLLHPVRIIKRLIGICNQMQTKPYRHFT